MVYLKLTYMKELPDNCTRCPFCGETYIDTKCMEIGKTIPEKALSGTNRPKWCPLIEE